MPYDEMTTTGGAYCGPTAREINHDREMQAKAEAHARQMLIHEPSSVGSDRPTLGSAFSALKEELAALEEMQREVMARLSPVLHPEPDNEGCKSQSPPDGGTAITNEVMGAMWNVRRMRNDLRRVLQRLDL